MIALSLFLLSGCVSDVSTSSSSEKMRVSNESVLQASGDIRDLIRLYKHELKRKEDGAMRLKLVQAYLDMQDYHSALFYLEPLFKRVRVPRQAYVLAGKAYLDLADWHQAESVLRLAYARARDNAEVLNLLGVVASCQGDFQMARTWFVRARHAMGDDVKINNNLALLDILAGHYRAAEATLTLLVRQDKHNKRLRANLAIVYAKLGKQKAFEQLLGDWPSSQRLRLFSRLRQLDMRNLSVLTTKQQKTGQKTAQQALPSALPSTLPKPLHLSEREQYLSSGGRGF
jgi:tight adherence protein D